MVDSLRIAKMIAEHYGMVLPIRIEVPKEDPTLLVALWFHPQICMDIVVESYGTYQLIQNACFKDAYPTDDAWREAILGLVESSTKIWAVWHDD